MLIPRKTVMVVAFALLLGAQGAFALDHAWSDSYGGTGSELAFDISANASGTVAVIGYFWDTVDFGSGPMTTAGSSDIYLASYDVSGNHLWSKRLGGVGGDTGWGVVIDDAGEVVMTGSFADSVDFGGGVLVSNGPGDIFLAKYDAAGNHLWSRSFGASDFDSGVDLDLDPAGNIALTGYFAGTVDFGGGPLTGPGGADLFLAKYGPDGSHQWSAVHGGAGVDVGWKVACDGDDILLTGFFKGTSSFGGAPLTSAGDYDIYLARYGLGGSHQWSQRVGGPLEDQPTAIDVDASGQVALTGYFNGTVDFGGGGLTSAGGRDVFLAQYDDTGAHQWSHRFGGLGRDQSYGVAVDSAGKVAITGSFINTIDFGGGTFTRTGLYDDLFVAQFDDTGAHFWSAGYGGGLEETARGIAVDGFDGLNITGVHEDTIDFGGSPLTVLGSFDVFVARFTPTVSGVRDPALASLPRIELHQNAPNPFNPKTLIRYEVPSPGRHVTLRIHDASGRLVRTLVDELQTAGEKQAVWLGRDDRGLDAASGVYFYRLTSPGFAVAKRMVLLR